MAVFIAFERQVAVFVLTAVLGKIFAVVQFQKLEKREVWFFNFMFLKMQNQRRQSLQFGLDPLRHECREQENQEHYFGSALFHEDEGLKIFKSNRSMSFHFFNLKNPRKVETKTHRTAQPIAV